MYIPIERIGWSRIYHHCAAMVSFEPKHQQEMMFQCRRYYNFSKCGLQRASKKILSRELYCNNWARGAQSHHYRKHTLESIPRSFQLCTSKYAADHSSLALLRRLNVIIVNPSLILVAIGSKAVPTCSAKHLGAFAFIPKV